MTQFVPNAMLAGPRLKGIYESGEQTIMSGGPLTLTHNLGGRPQIISCWLVCKTAEGGYLVGEETPVNPAMNNDVSTVTRGLSIIRTATQLQVRFASDTSALNIIHAITGARFQITNANWRLVIEAFRWA